MDREIIFVVEEAPEGGYQARALGSPIFTEADTLDELKRMAQDAVRCHFDKTERPSIVETPETGRRESGKHLGGMEWVL